MQLISKKGRTAGRPGAHPQEKLQVLLVGLDHLLDHLTDDRTCLAAGQVAVVAVFQVDAHLVGGLHLKLIHRGLGLGDVQLVAVLTGHIENLLSVVER